MRGGWSTSDVSGSEQRGGVYEQLLRSLGETDTSGRLGDSGFLVC